MVREWNKGKASLMAAIDELFADNYVEHGGGGEETHGAKNYKKSMNDFFTAFPDMHMSIDNMIAEGDKVAVRFTFSGTHKGEFAGNPPTNKKWSAWGIYVDRIVDGKFVESWVRYDTMGFMHQLGFAPKLKKC